MLDFFGSFTAIRLGVDSVSILSSHRFFFKKQPFPKGFRFSRKKDPWKEWGSDPYNFVVLKEPCKDLGSVGKRCSIFAVLDLRAAHAMTPKKIGSSFS